MKRKKLIAGNWKMNLTPREAAQLIAAVRAEIDRDDLDDELTRSREVMVAPPFVAIPVVAEVLAGSRIELGAQNMHFEDKGAFTGEVSAPMLKALGVRYVILGHSERRHIFGESDELINKKVRAALHHRLHPIMCVGETQAEHDSGRALAVVLRQLQNGLEGVAESELGVVTLAYEPVWAIGTGLTATPQQAEMVHAAIRAALKDRYGEAGHAVRILYGGSVTPDNVDSLVSKPDIDGALVGGASLKVEAFIRIVRADLTGNAG
jgi:triosephosphate isomerase (TIM)